MSHGPAKHYRYAPSSASRWIVCPAAAQPDLPESKNEHTIRGNALHTQASYCLVDSLPVFGHSSDADAVRQVVAFAQSLGGEKHYETELVSAIVKDFGGTADILSVTEDTIHVVDAKFGKYRVAARGNPQGKCYVNLARERFPDRAKFQFTIIQPAAYKNPQTASFSVAELDKHLGCVIWAATHPQIKVTGDHCLFCVLRKCGQCDEGAEFVERKGWSI